MCTWVDHVGRCTAAYEMLGEDATGQRPAEVTFILPKRNVTLADLEREPLTPEEELVREEYAAFIAGNGSEDSQHSSSYCGHHGDGIINRTEFWKESCGPGACAHATNHWYFVYSQGYVFWHVGYSPVCHWL